MKPTIELNDIPKNYKDIRDKVKRDTVVTVTNNGEKDLALLDYGVYEKMIKLFAEVVKTKELEMESSDNVKIIFEPLKKNAEITLSKAIENAITEEDMDLINGNMLSLSYLFYDITNR